MILSIGICRIRCSEKYTENRSFVGGATNRNQDLAEWEQAVKNGQKPAEKQHRPPEKQSVRNRLRQLPCKIFFALQGVLLNIRIIKYYNYCNPVIKITNDIIVITVQPMYLPAISQSDGSAFSTFRI